MPDRVLVTGGAGCIGSELARQLLRRGAHVTIIDNLSCGKIERVEPMLGDARVRFVEGALLDPYALDGVMLGVDTVFHLAANPDAKFTAGDPTDKDLKQNTIATYHVLESMRQHGVRRLVFASTSAVYGISEVQPIPEDAPAHPISLYGATKLSCEALIGAFENLFEMKCWILRFANVVGPEVRKTGRTVIGDFVARLG
jgi:UDP-glucose 4-epimerase